MIQMKGSGEAASEMKAGSTGSGRLAVDFILPPNGFNSQVTDRAPRHIGKDVCHTPRFLAVKCFMARHPLPWHDFTK